LDPLNPDAWFTLGILHGLIASQLNPDEGLNRATVYLYKKNAVMELRKAFQLVGTLDPVQGNRYHHELGLMFGDRANFSGKLPESVLNTYYACGEPDPTILMNMNTAAWCDAWDKMESDLMHKSPQHYYRKRDFGTAIKILPEYVDAHYQLGLSQSTQTAEALQSFNRCIELAPDDARCWRARGELLQKLNRAGEGQSDLERARVLERATSRNDVKWCRDRIGADAIAACSAIIARHPTEVVPYIYRAWTQFVGGDKDLALKDFSKAVDIAPARGDLYYQRGNFYVETKQWREAELDFSKAIELGYDLRGTYVLKGLSL